MEISVEAWLLGFLLYLSIGDMHILLLWRQNSKLGRSKVETWRENLVRMIKYTSLMQSCAKESVFDGSIPSLEERKCFDIIEACSAYAENFFRISVMG